MRARLTGLGLLIAVIGTACGGGGGDGKGAGAGGRPKDVAAVMAAVKGLDREQRAARLAELAKAEGATLTFYTSMTTEDSNALITAFQKAYGVRVSLFRADTEALAQRVTSEAEAGQTRADVLEGDELGFVAIGADRFAPYTSPVVDDLIPEARHKYWTSVQRDIFVLTWNSGAVKAAERPTAWEDLADPRWKGRLAMEASDVVWYAGLRDYWISRGKSEVEADRLFAAMAANARAVKGHSLMVQLLMSGEFDVAASPFLNRVRQLVAEGAPIAYEPVVEPLIAKPGGVAVLRGARNPAAAVLFTDWLLSKGQDEFVKLNRFATRADLQPSNPSTILDVDVEKLAPNFADWQARYERLLEGAPVVSDGK